MRAILRPAPNFHRIGSLSGLRTVILRKMVPTRVTLSDMTAWPSRGAAAIARGAVGPHMAPHCATHARRPSGVREEATCHAVRHRRDTSTAPIRPPLALRSGTPRTNIVHSPSIDCARWARRTAHKGMGPNFPSRGDLALLCPIAVSVSHTSSRRRLASRAIPGCIWLPFRIISPQGGFGKENAPPRSGGK